jgi:hypothetical protein
MKQPTPSDFIVNVKESSVSVIFKPNNPAAVHGHQRWQSEMAVAVVLDLGILRVL